MSRPNRRLPAPCLLAALLALAGCAAPAATVPTAVTPSPLTRAAAPVGGVIVAVRPAPLDTPARRSVLAALGLPPTAANGDVEIIVRADDGQPVSVLQNDAGDLRVGDRVALVAGQRTRIAAVRVARAAR